MSGSDQHRRFEQNPPELTSEETVTIPAPGEAPKQVSSEYVGQASHFPEAVGGFPHAPHGELEGPLEEVEPTDLLEVRMDDDKFEEHSPLGAPPTHRRIHPHPDSSGHLPK